MRAAAVLATKLVPPVPACSNSLPWFQSSLYRTHTAGRARQSNRTVGRRDSTDSPQAHHLGRTERYGPDVGSLLGVDRCALLSLRTMNKPSPEVEECPFCRAAIRPGAIVFAACGALKDKKMGCSGCLALIGPVVCTFGVFVMVTLFSETQHSGAAGFTIFAGLVYAGGAALCYWALSRRRRLKWYRRM